MRVHDMTIPTMGNRLENIIGRDCHIQALQERTVK